MFKICSSCIVFQPLDWIWQFTEKGFLIVISYYVGSGQYLDLRGTLWENLMHYHIGMVVSRNNTMIYEDNKWLVIYRLILIVWHNV